MLWYAYECMCIVTSMNLFVIKLMATLMCLIMIILMPTITVMLALMITMIQLIKLRYYIT